MNTNENDEIEINGIKYVRKQEQIFDAVRSPTNSQYLYQCGAPDCDDVASSHSDIRNTVIVRNIDDDESYDLVVFTCANGHRNKLRI